MLKKLTRLGRLALPVILILFILLPVRANTQGISKISLKGKNITIATLFKTIKKQTGLTVFYSNKLLDDTEKITVDFNQAELAEVLNSTLKSKGLSWVVKEKYIVLQKAATPAVPVDNKTEQGAVNNVRQKIGGTVTDASGTAMPGVGVKVKETNAGTVTDQNGRYSIEANSGNTLLFSYVGYASQEILVGNQTSINVKLQTDDTDLTEVVVVGYGTQKK
ncbi:carboxypeptidase-like regulatory domain-containing protein [Pedobacter steynii]